MDENLLDIVSRAQRGDKKSYEKIYNIYFKKIFRYCNINLGDAELAQDICQDTFIKGWKAITSFNMGDGASIQAYLFRIARNLMIDHSRKKHTLPLEHAENVESRDRFEDDLEREDDIDRVRKALSSLEEVERQIVILRFFEEMSFTEAAAITGENEGALRVRTHRVLKKLKDILEGGKING